MPTRRLEALQELHLQSDFDGGAAAGADRDAEKIFFSRMQLAF